MILVTGGTGLVGAHLLFNLVQNGHQVRATHRASSQLKNVEKIFSYYTENATQLFQKIEWIEADLNDIPALENAFENISYVYHAAAFISFDPNDFNQLMKINAEGTANIVNLSIEFNVKKLCYVSTIGTIGKNLNNKPANEESEWHNQHVNVYAKSKYVAEMEVWRGTQEGLQAVMVNPGVIIGPGFWKTGTGKLFRTAYKAYRYYPPGGSGFVSVHDVVKAMVNLMAGPHNKERYIMVAENLSFLEILSRMTKNYNKKPPNKKLKYWQLELARLVDILRNKVTGSKRSITKNSIYSLIHRDAYDNSKIIEELNFSFEPIEELLTFSCKKFIEELPV